MDTTSPRYIRVADVAKALRKALKAAFPGVRFSVRSESYSGGASIDVRWTDGPHAKDVDQIAKRYNGSDFDGLIDQKTHYHHWDCPNHGLQVATHYGSSFAEQNGVINARCCDRAEKVSLGVDFVFTHHSHSPAAVEAAKAEMAARYGKPYGLGDSPLENTQGNYHWRWDQMLNRWLEGER